MERREGNWPSGPSIATGSYTLDGVRAPGYKERAGVYSEWAEAAARELAGPDADGPLALRVEPRDMTGAARTLLRMGGPSGGLGRGVNWCQPAQA
ncbi:MAG: hypothetical protein COW16_08845 [Sphingomonadales bacterium CG12_big_fil_rev_8_21_14_0_65_65_10]|nr:MAG: hypothetical protein COW16_08845 [Sphingomonadales bacterium CG12_big_fil_rev_8_21_14_0_65_65_10]